MFISSNAQPADIEQYCYGQCHMFAVALHRLTGWPIHLVLDDDEKHWIDPNDDDNWIPATVHAFCIDDQDRFWDVKGIRGRNEVYAELTSWVNIADYRSETLWDEECLKAYTGCWADDGEPIDRPLSAYNDLDVEEATRTLKSLFPDITKEVLQAETTKLQR